MDRRSFLQWALGSAVALTISQKALAADELKLLNKTSKQSNLTRDEMLSAVSGPIYHAPVEKASDLPTDAEPMDARFCEEDCCTYLYDAKLGWLRMTRMEVGDPPCES